MACRDDDFATPADWLVRGFVRLTGDNRKWHRQRRCRVRRWHRRRPTLASANSGLRVFDLLATAPREVSASLSSTLGNETRAAGLHHFIETLPGLNAIDFVERVFRKGGDVEVL